MTAADDRPALVVSSQLDRLNGPVERFPSPWVTSEFDPVPSDAKYASSRRVYWGLGLSHGAEAGGGASTAGHRGQAESRLAKKPTLRTYEMICFDFCGMADEDELMQHIKKLNSQDA